MHDDPSTGPATAIINSDTLALDLDVLDRVQCTVGNLKGVQGVMVATRAQGRVLVRLGRVIYLELPRICVERLKPEVRQ